MITGMYRSLPAVIIDTETTGVDTETDRIVQLGVVTYEPDTRLVYRDSILVTPGVPIPPGATEVHHITDEMVAGGGVEPRVALEVIATALEDVARAPGYIVGVYNAPYDLSLIRAECRRHGLDDVWGRISHVVRGRLVDPLVIDKAVDRYRRGSRRLMDTCAHYGVETADLDAHDACGDAVATLRLIHALPSDRVAAMVRVASQGVGAGESVESLCQAQRIWAREQQESLRAYFSRTSPERADSMRMGWPVYG